jgi:hypothetical protein
MGAIRQMNTAVEGFEKGGVGANERVQKAAERMADMLLKVSDRSRSSMERLTQSIEKQAAAYGKTGIERMIAERDRMIKKLGDEQGMVDRVTAAYAKMISSESQNMGAAGIEKLGSAASESRASLALLGEEIGIRIPRHVRGFISTMPGVEEALSMGFKTIAVAAVVMVLYEAIKKAVEFRGRLEELRIASERESAELQRFTDGQKLANDEMRVANDRLEVAIAKLEGKPRNELKLAIDEAALAADHLTEKLDKALRSFYEIVQKNAPGTFAQIVGRQPSTTDIQEMVGGKSGYGGMIGEMYKATAAGQDPTQVLAQYRAQAQQLLARSEFAQSFQTGTLALNDPRRQDKSMYPVDSTQQQGPRIEVLNALIHQIDLQAQSYGLEKQGNALAAKKAGLENRPETDRAAAEQLKEFRRATAEFEKRGDEAELDAIGKIYYQRDLLLKQAEKLKGVEAEIAGIRQSADNQVLTERVKEHVKDLNRGLVDDRNLDKGVAEHVARLNAGLDSDRERQRQAEERDRKALAKDVLGYQEAMVRLQSGPGGELETAQKIFMLRVQSADTLLEKQAAALDYLKQAAQIQSDADNKHEEELQRQQDALTKTSSGLLHTLFTRPSEFPKQLGNTVHEAVLKPVTEGLGGMVAGAIHPLIYGSDGQGGIAGMFKGAFGGKQDPMKVATDMNTAVTAQNSMVVATLTAVLSGVMGMAPPAMAAPAGIGGLSLPAISAPAVSGPAASAGGGFSPIIGGAGGFGGGLPTSVGMSALLGGGAVGHAAGGGGILPALMSAGRPGAAPTGVAGILKNFKGMNWGGLTHGPDVYSTDANGSDIESPGRITGVSGVAGAALFTGGSMLAQQGLLGSSRGTWGGVAEGTLGGAAIGFQMGGPLGAAIGGGVGLGIGLGEKIAGVESPESEAKRLIKSLYGVSIDTSMAKQIVSIAQSKYAGHVSIAVRDQDVRKMLELYAQGTGQKMPLSATTPRGGSLAEQGGNLYQQASYVNGTPYTFQSSLPVLGGLGGGTYPTPGSPNTAGGGGTTIALNINGQPITPEFVTDQSLSAQNSSYNRVQQSANMQIPGLMVGT